MSIYADKRFVSNETKKSSVTRNDDDMGVIFERLCFSTFFVETKKAYICLFFASRIIY